MIREHGEQEPSSVRPGRTGQDEGAPGPTGLFRLVRIFWMATLALAVYLLLPIPIALLGNHLPWAQTLLDPLVNLAYWPLYWCYEHHVFREELFGYSMWLGSL